MHEDDYDGDDTIQARTSEHNFIRISLQKNITHRVIWMYFKDYILPFLPL